MPTTTRPSFQLPTPPSQSPPPNKVPTARRLSSATTVTTTLPITALKKSAPATPPWRPPGYWKMPDIIQETWKQKQQPPSRRPEPPKPSTSHHTNKPRWVNVGKAPDHFPLPTPRRSTATTTAPPKPHAVFDAKLRKVLPRTKLLAANPKVYYTGTEQVGSGANGAVIRAVSRQKTPVAIKRCFIEDHDTHHHSYVLRELRIMGRLSHVNLIHLEAACLYEDHLWMAMELMACSVFGLLFNTTVGLDEPTTVLVVRNCLEGLVYLHSKNYMHRDVKSENILLGHNGQVKLADFGLATPVSHQNSARLGTAKWMAPEVVTESFYTENVDVWSLGITLIEMMDRVPPLYYLENTVEIYQEILYGKQPSFHFTTPSTALQNLLDWMLNPDGHHRPMANDVLQNLDQFISKGHLKCALPSDLAKLVQEVFPV